MKFSIGLLGLSLAIIGLFTLTIFTPTEKINIKTSASANKTELAIKYDPRLLPDLIPYPAKDLEIQEEDDNIYLLFTTMFYNNGRGPLELIADPATKGIRADIERNVLQRIYNENGTYEDKIAGTFLWHQEHLHYHYKDFVIYDLEPIKALGATDLEGNRVKSTFCIRDVSKTDAILENTLEKAKYLICGKELQGISVGWADTYFNYYPDQRLNITDLPSGTYRLSFIVNPESILEESDSTNNISSIEFRYNKNSGEVKILDESPADLPNFEHVHIDQQFEQ
ncbi:MAG: hypothetical protein HYS87_00950 [Candidatus Colwellbacteria bacterium]|nr:hypothetical protein [Candidatus Colwellbacteria bacterium]